MSVTSIGITKPFNEASVSAGAEISAKGSLQLKPQITPGIKLQLNYDTADTNRNVEDLSGNRELALSWYRRACELDAPNIQGIRKVAERGLGKPVTWIRHLDEGSKSPKQHPSKNDVI